MVQTAKIFPNATIGQGYGMTETCTIAMLDPDLKFGTLGSGGVLVPGIFAKVVKPDGSLGKDGEEGELIVTGSCMALGYYENPAAYVHALFIVMVKVLTLIRTAETFVDGWVRTGDEVIIRNNEVFIIDRVKVVSNSSLRTFSSTSIQEILKVRGFQVAPAELEGHLLLHPFVADACVVGIPDEYSGEVPLAFIVPSQAASERIGNAEDGAEKVRKEIQKVSPSLRHSATRIEKFSSMFRMQRCHTSGLRVGWCSLTRYPRIHLERL